MAKKTQRWPFWEQVMWWCINIGAGLCVVSIIPVLPWRYNRVDTNVGNRFVMERYYYIMGPSNNLGKTEGWLSMRKKMQRKTEEFGRPSPLTALLGTVASAADVGGAATGCMMWMVCKNHVADRYIMYTSIAYASIGCMLFTLIGAGCGVACTVFQGFEMDAVFKGKKKKKKKDEDCMQPVTKTMCLGICSFMMCGGSATLYICYTGSILKGFKRTAYYPYAGAHIASFMAGLGAFVLFIGMLCAVNRTFHCLSKDKKDDEGLAQWEQGGGGWEAGGGGYGGGAGGYGGGGYGGGPGGYGQQQW